MSQNHDSGDHDGINRRSLASQVQTTAGLLDVLPIPCGQHANGDFHPLPVIEQAAVACPPTRPAWVGGVHRLTLAPLRGRVHVRRGLSPARHRAFQSDRAGRSEAPRDDLRPGDCSGGLPGRGQPARSAAHPADYGVGGSTCLVGLRRRLTGWRRRPACDAAAYASGRGGDLDRLHLAAMVALVTCLLDGAEDRSPLVVAELAADRLHHAHGDLPTARRETDGAPAG